MSEEFDPTLEADRATGEPAMIVDVEGFEGPLDLLRSWRWPINISRSSKRRANCGWNWPPITW
jgi:hypothetical protein